MTAPFLPPLTPPLLLPPPPPYIPPALAPPPAPRIPSAAYFALPALCDLLSVATDMNGEQFVEKVYAPLLRNKFFKALVVAFAVAVTATLTW